MKPAAVFFAMALTGAAADLEVAIELYIAAGVQPEALRRTLARVDRIFAGTSISLRWQGCEEKCGTVEGAFGIGLTASRTAAPESASALGYAMLGPGDGRRAVVLIPRVTWHADRAGVPLEIVLAHAIAHELGHVLMRSARHAPGIMEAHWGRETSRRMMQGTLGFCPAQAAAMRHRVTAETTRVASAVFPIR